MVICLRISLTYSTIFSGALDGIEALKQSFNLPIVIRKDWQYMIPNILILIVMLIAFLILHGINLLFVGLINLTGWITISAPTLFSTISVLIWIQISIWSLILTNFFYTSGEDCFYARLNQLAGDSKLVEVHGWKVNWSFIDRTWSSFKRTIQ